jgi:hypothetical protein
MEREGVRFIKPAVISKMEKLDSVQGSEKKEQIRVTWTDSETKQEGCEVFDTVLHAIGRDAVLADLHVQKVRLLGW